jgi:hypothetical protein
VARNEVFFRDANELAEREVTQRRVSADVFICECSSRGCLARLAVSNDVYERVRDQPDRFIVKPGHEDSSVEVVVERHPDFYVIQKLGAAGEVARAENPR